MKNNWVNLTTAITYIVIINSTPLEAQNKQSWGISGNNNTTIAMRGTANAIFKGIATKNSDPTKVFSAAEVNVLTSYPNVSSLSDLIFINKEVAEDLSNKTILGREDAVVTPSICSEKKILEVRDTNISRKSYVVIDCNLTLDSPRIIRKRMLFQGRSASGVTVDLNGSTVDCGKKGTVNYEKYMIQVMSTSIDTIIGNEKVRLWQRPENVTIKNGNIIGSVRVTGMTEITHAESTDRQFAEKARNNAPKNLTFDNITISAKGRRNALYFGAGVSYSKLINSELKGQSDSGVAIYLNSESYKNIIKNNYIHTVTPRRELMAIDGSSYNMIINNRFSALNNGGIFLYRNCGEGGWVRHSTPSYNHIINNVFYYNTYTGSKQAIYIGSRNGHGSESYTCDVDWDPYYPYGSSAFDLDSATNNIVMQNRIIKRSACDMIQVNNKAVNSNNIIKYNDDSVLTAPTRPAGCYISNGYQKDFIVERDFSDVCDISKGYQKDFILDRESIDVFRNSKGEPICTGYKKTCSDGYLTTASAVCNITKISFECQVSGSNDGCKKTVGCPAGQKIIGATAAANLEFGSVSDNELLAVPVNTLKVVKTSDVLSQGYCFIGDNNLSSGQSKITSIKGLQTVSVGCKERDENGGDCHVKGILFCYGTKFSIVNPNNNELTNDRLLKNSVVTSQGDPKAENRKKGDL